MILDFSNIESIQALQYETDAPWKTSITEFIEFYISPAPTLFQKTSGSTGQPKEISLSRETLNASAQSTISFFHIREKSSALLCIPAEYIGGKMMIVRSFIGKWNLECIEPKLQLVVPEKEFEFAAMIPAQVQHLLEVDLPALLRIKNLIIGGAPVSLELEKKLKELKINAYSTYGMTETASHVALKKLDLNSAFKALSGITFQTDMDGCLRIIGARIPNSPLQTNDVVEILLETEFIWKGRKDHIINSGGLKILVEELEKNITTLIETPFYVTKSTHSKFGETPVLVLERQTISEKEKSELLEKLKSHLSKNHAPTEVICKPLFHYSINGKILRN